MNATTKKQLIADAAKRLGFELVKADCHRNFFHLRRGTEVRLGFIDHKISAFGIRAAVGSAITFGMRLDRAEGSRYFAANQE